MDSMTQRAARQMVDSDHQSASVMSQEPPPPAGGWKTEDVSIKKASNGGFIVRCSRTREGGEGGGNGPVPAPNGSTYKSDELAFSSIDEVLNFVTTEFGGPTQTEPDLGDGAEEMA